MNVEYDTAEGMQHAVATTLGAGGMFVATEEPLPVQTPLKLRFRLEAGGALHEIEGHVVWANRPEDAHGHTCGMGIEFGDPAARSALAWELEGAGVDRDDDRSGSGPSGR